MACTNPSARGAARVMIAQQEGGRLACLLSRSDPSASVPPGSPRADHERIPAASASSLRQITRGQGPPRSAKSPLM